MNALRLRLSPAATSRLQGVDELKGVAIILVILYHAGGVLVWNNFFHFDLGVDLFVILSGVGLAFGARYEGAGPFLARRLVRILPAYWLVLSLCWLANVHFLQEHYTSANLWVHYAGLQGWFAGDYAFAINDSFWYISLILALYVFYCACHALLESPDLLLLAGAAISAFTGWILFLSDGLTGHLGLRVPGFFLGLLLGRLLKTGQIELRLGPPLAFAGLLLAYLPYLYGFVFYPPLVALSVMGLYLALARDRRFPFSRSLKFLGDHSLEIFLIHQPLIREYNLYLYRTWFHNPAPDIGLRLLGIALGLTLTLFLSAALHRLLLLVPLPYSARGPASRVAV